ncbi:DUF3748 domain-containing protein [Olivibacter ginsenosidimutans]|uniref:DUF3748 domain-containing protein n=2 Tax=Olivibacter ginsenosidimutans TaxID=1176537 RepID=A0ABP9AGL6_9SPHI
MLGMACQDNFMMKFTEKQLTFSAEGHTIHNTQVFSKDGQWIVYDTRNDDTQIGSTSSIELVHTKTGERRVLYRTNHQSTYGPGVGAATFSPVADTVIFIHGIRNADISQPYSATRRTGVAIAIDHPLKPIFMDARDIMPPFTKGALRGGTHAHSWSGDGQWISFTYNDYIMEQLAKKDSSVRDLRTVGVMVPGTVQVEADTADENNSGQRFSAIVAKVVDHPEPGTDEIDKAYDEGWIGGRGYLRKDGSWQHRAIAFQGDTRNTKNKLVTEVFVLDLPDDIYEPASVDEPLEGTIDQRPGVPKGIIQRRLTHTEKGIIGPRHWLRSTTDGKLIAFLTEDKQGFVQLYSVSPQNGEIKVLTHNHFSVTGPFNFSPDGQYIAYPGDGSIWVTKVASGETVRITEKFAENDKPIGAPVWSPNGKMIAYNRYVEQREGLFLQVFLLTLV